MKAILLSGGMDSIAITFWKRPSIAITIDYGQKAAAAEQRAASAVCLDLGIQHYVISADLGQLGSGDLNGTPALPISRVSEWWPFRNQMLVTLAAMKCVSVGVKQILIGALKTDSIHVDGTKGFIRELDVLLGMQEGGLSLDAPAIELTAAELITISGVPDEILGWAHSCHISDFACGSCRGCQKHYLTLKELGRAPY